MKRLILIAALAFSSQACRPETRTAPDAAPTPKPGEAARGGEATATQTPLATTAAPPPGATPAPAPDSPAPGRDAPAGVDEGWTNRAVARPREGGQPALLGGVRAARHEGFDRVVFEFEGARAPGHHVEYVDRPVRRCGSGEAARVAGDAWLRVSLTPARAHTEAGEATVERRELSFDFPALRELESICDFEAEVVWVLGVASANRFRVTELSSPARLVVDVRH